MTDTNQLTITHPDLPGAIFQPRLDTDGHSVAYWGAHLFMGGATVCETIIGTHGDNPRYIVDTPEVGDGMTIDQLHEFVATINAYYAAVTRDRAHHPETSQKKGA